MPTDAARARLGEAVRSYRLAHRLRQKDVERRGGPSDVTIRGLENGNGRPPSASTIRKLDQGLGWPKGTAEKILRGEADVAVSTDGEGVQAVVVDPSAEADGERGPGLDATSGDEHRTLRTEPTAELLTELAARYRNQAERLQELETENERLRRHEDCPHSRPPRSASPPA